MPERFPPLWSVDDPDPRLDRPCFIIRDANGHALAYVYFEEGPGRERAAPSCGILNVTSLLHLTEIFALQTLLIGRSGAPPRHPCARSRSLR